MAARLSKKVAEFVDQYGDIRTIHRKKDGVLAVAREGVTIPQAINQAIQKHLGPRIKELRLASGLSQRQLLMRAGLSGQNPKQRMHNIESGSDGIRLGTLYCLAFALRCRIEDLLPSPETMLEAAQVSAMPFHTLEMEMAQ